MQREQAVMELTLTDPFFDVAREFVKPAPRVARVSSWKCCCSI